MLRKLLNGLRWLLWPLSFVYKLITHLRNYGYDSGLKKVYQSSIYTISVGNLTIGGTGKTPHIEYLVRLLGKQYILAILSRGYGRKTRGFGQANHFSTAADIGDESLQLYQKFGETIPIFVCEKRAVGLQAIEKTDSKSQIVLLDDAFQHRAILPRLNLLLTDYGRLFYQDEVLPMGLLRESKQGAKRAHAVIVTKCPTHLSPATKAIIRNEIANFTMPQIPVFFSSFEYSLPIPYFSTLPKFDFKTSYWLVSGIAQPRTFETAAAKYFNVKGHTVMGDHYFFTEEEVRKWIEIATHTSILTTEKDYVKIKPILQKMEKTSSSFYYWPIEVRFDNEGFDTFILSSFVVG